VSSLEKIAQTEKLFKISRKSPPPFPQKFLSTPLPVDSLIPSHTFFNPHKYFFDILF